MKNDLKKLIFFILLLWGCMFVSAGESREVHIRFRVGKTFLDEKLGDNAACLQEIIDYLQKVNVDSTLTLTEVSFCGSASPEGGLKRNRYLAATRCRTLENYVRSRVALPDSIVSRRILTFDWEQLARLVGDSDMPYKDEAVDVILNVPEFTYNARGVLVDSRKKHLMELQYGRTWKYMLRHFFPRIRHAGVIMVTVTPKPVAVEAPESVEVCEVPTDEPALPPPTDTLAVAVEPVIEVSADGKAGSFLWALKTNLLYDALTLPNIGAEVRLADRWTLGADWFYGWWNNNFSRHYFLRAYGGGLSLRRWLGRQPFGGHHVGIYGQLFTYDFRKGNRGYMCGEPGGTLWDRISYAAGVEYGYSLPLHGSLHLDFSVGLGYMAGTVYEYTPDDGCKVWQRTHTRHWFGPTKAEVSLVWVFGKGGGK